MNASIYEQIKNAVTEEGTLPKDFELTQENTEEFQWAPGAQDGVFLYHMRYDDPAPEQLQLLEEALRSAGNTEFEHTEELFDRLTQELTAIQLIDPLQEFIQSHVEELDAKNMYLLGVTLVTSSTKVELVKIGLSILELFQLSDQMKEVVCTLGLYDEFTLFAVWTMRQWENRNQALFDLVKKVRSWGRIHIVEELEPQTEEIRQWLLTDGCDNDVMPAYSALTCWTKSGAEEVLFGDVTPVEFQGLSLLIEGLLDEGPVPGISRVENAAKVLERYVDVAATFDLTLEHYQVIDSVLDTAMDEEAPFPAVAQKCQALLQSEACKKVLLEAIKEGRGLELAAEVGLPFQETLFALMKEDLPRYFAQCRFLLNDSDYLEPTLELFRKNIPLERIPGQLEKGLGIGEEYRLNHMLDFVLQELRDKPLKGMEFVTAGLRSWVSRNRNIALSVVKSWVEQEQTPLLRLSAKLYAAVSAAKGQETDLDRLKDLEALLEGQTTFAE